MDIGYAVNIFFDSLAYQQVMITPPHDLTLATDV